jgi:hypothetical protein
MIGWQLRSSTFSLDAYKTINNHNFTRLDAYKQQQEEQALNILL